MRQGPLVMFSNVDMILLFQFPSKDQVKIIHLTTSFLDHLPSEEELQLTFWVKRSRLLVLDMQLGEESTLEQIRDLISFFGLDLFSEFLNDYFIDVFIEGQQNGLFLAVDTLVVPTLKGIWENHLIFLLDYYLFISFPLDSPNENYRYEFWRSLVMNALSRFKICCLQLRQDDVLHHRR